MATRLSFHGDAAAPVSTAADAGPVIGSSYDAIRYDTRCYFNVRSKADISQLNLPHGNTLGNPCDQS